MFRIQNAHVVANRHHAGLPRGTARSQNPERHADRSNCPACSPGWSGVWPSQRVQETPLHAGKRLRRGPKRSITGESGFQTSVHGASSRGAVKVARLQANIIVFVRLWRLIVGIMACLAISPVRAEFGDELFKLNASDAATDDQFGRRVDISGNVAIVGAPKRMDTRVRHIYSMSRRARNFTD